MIGAGSTANNIRNSGGILKITGQSAKRTRTLRALLASLVLILALITCALVLISIISAKMSNRRQQHAIVFDAGSTHTQMLIFSWLSDKSDGAFDTAWVKQTYSYEIPVGISTLATETSSSLKSEVHGYFSGLFDRADSSIPHDDRAKTNVLLGATAGMRLLQLGNFEAADIILKEIRDYIVKRGYRLANNHDVRIISGREEALYGWISANILMSKINPRSRKCTPVAITDLGGASMQVAFQFDPTSGLVRNSLINQITLYGTNFQVFGRSFLCWGKEQSHYRYLSLLIRNFSTKHQSNVADPCGTRGNVLSSSASEIETHPCILGPSRLDLETYNFHGTGDSASCAAMMKQLFDRPPNIRHVNNNDDDDDDDYTPIEDVNKMIGSEREKQRFVAFSGFFHVWKALGSPIGRKGFEYQLSRFCQIDLDQWKTRSRNNSLLLFYNLRLCYDGHYMLALIDRLGFNVDDIGTEMLLPVHKVDKKHIGWAFGYVVNSSNSIPKDYSPFTPSIATFNYATVGLLCLVLLLTVIAIACYVISGKL